MSQLFNTTNPPLSYPYDVAVDSAGNVFVAEYGNSRVVQLSASSALLWTFNISNPTAVVFDSRGLLYIASTPTISAQIMQVNPATSTVLAQFNTTGPALGADVRLAVDSADNLYVSDAGSRQVVKLSTTTGLVTTYNSTNPQLTGGSYSGGVALDRSGRVWLADYSNSRAVQFGANGSLLAVLSSTVLGDAVPYPTDVAVDASGNVYITSSSLNTALVVNANNSIVYVYNTSATSYGALFYLNAGKLDMAGNYFYLCDTYNNRVLKMAAIAQPANNSAADRWGSSLSWFVSVLVIACASFIL